MYDGKTQMLLENPINRYLINSPMRQGRTQPRSRECCRVVGWPCAEKAWDTGQSSTCTIPCANRREFEIAEGTGIATAFDHDVSGVNGCNPDLRQPSLWPRCLRRTVG